MHWQGLQRFGFFHGEVSSILNALIGTVAGHEAAVPFADSPKATPAWPGKLELLHSTAKAALFWPLGA